MNINNKAENTNINGNNGIKSSVLETIESKKKKKNFSINISEIFESKKIEEIMPRIGKFKHEDGNMLLVKYEGTQFIIEPLLDENSRITGYNLFESKNGIESKITQDNLGNEVGNFDFESLSERIDNIGYEYISELIIDKEKYGFSTNLLMEHIVAIRGKNMEKEDFLKEINKEVFDFFNKSKNTPMDVKKFASIIHKEAIKSYNI